MDAKPIQWPGGPRPTGLRSATLGAYDEPLSSGSDFGDADDKIQPNNADNSLVAASIAESRQIRRGVEGIRACVVPRQQTRRSSSALTSRISSSWLDRSLTTNDTRSSMSLMARERPGSCGVQSCLKEAPGKRQCASAQSAYKPMAEKSIHLSDSRPNTHFRPPTADQLKTIRGENRPREELDALVRRRTVGFQANPGSDFREATLRPTTARHAFLIKEHILEQLKLPRHAPLSIAIPPQIPPRQAAEDRSAMRVLKSCCGFQSTVAELLDETEVGRPNLLKIFRRQKAEDEAIAEHIASLYGNPHGMLREVHRPGSVCIGHKELTPRFYELQKGRE